MGMHAPSVSLVAQQGAGGLWLWLALLGVAIVAGGYLLLTIRRRLLGSDEASSGGMTLEDLRRLHAEGQLSDEEFGRLKEQLIAEARPKQRHATVEALQRRKGSGDGGSGAP